MSNSSDKLRTLKSMRFDKRDKNEEDKKLYDALQVLLKFALESDETTFAIRHKAFNVYYYGNSLMRIEHKEKEKELLIEFNAGHFRYYKGNRGVYSKKDKGFKIWDEGWKKIAKELNSDLGKFIECKLVELNYEFCEYPEIAKQAYIKAEKEREAKKGKERKSIRADVPEWKLTAHIHDVKEAEDFVKYVCEPILKAAVKSYVDNHYSKEKSNELRYAQNLFRHNGWEQFSKGSLPSLFFSDSGFKLPNNKRPLLEKEPATEEMLRELDAWPDKIFNDAKEIALPGSPDGVGAFRNEDGEVVPCLIEVKNGIGAYDGDSGIQKHLRDMVILAKHTIEDRKKEIDFSYSYRKKIEESNGGHIDWSKTGNPLILFILRHESIEEVIDKLEKVISKDYVKDVREHIKEVDVEFVITEKSDGTDFITCYKNKDRRFTLKNCMKANNSKRITD